MITGHGVVHHGVSHAAAVHHGVDHAAVVHHRVDHAAAVHHGVDHAAVVHHHRGIVEHGVVVGWTVHVHVTGWVGRRSLSDKGEDRSYYSFPFTSNYNDLRNKTNILTI